MNEKQQKKIWRCLFRETWFVWITRNESPIVQFWKGTTIAVGSIECGEEKKRPKPTNLLPLSHSQSLWFFPLLVAHNFNLSCNAKQSTTYHSISIRFVSNRDTHTHTLRLRVRHWSRHISTATIFNIIFHTKFNADRHSYRHHQRRRYHKSMLSVAMENCHIKRSIIKLLLHRIAFIAFPYDMKYTWK